MTTGKSNFKFESGLIYQIFKYSLYAFLAMNIYHFFVEDSGASAQLFSGNLNLSQIIEAYTATIDTTAWIILLLLFELETYILDDDQIKGATKWSMHLVRLICYSFIVYSFYGYMAKLIVMYSFSPFSIADVCSLVGSSFTYMQDIDEFPPLSAQSCTAFADQAVFQINGTEIIATQQALIDAQRLAWVDVINSATWLLVVFILEFEVWLQLGGKLTQKRLYLITSIKSVLYAILLLAAIYWGFKGDFLDFWDAFLWLLAFAFIELNVFEWNTETRAEETSA